MAENSSIEWTDATFNPWTGCTKVSPGCDHCYAESWSKRAGAKVGKWGPGAPRVRTTPANWRTPLQWNAEQFVQCAECGYRCGLRSFKNPNYAGVAMCPACSCTEWHGSRRRVFCASLADVFDNEVPLSWRSDLFDLIDATPNLDWQLLTKRIGNVVPMMRDIGTRLLPGVGAGVIPRTGLPSNVWLGATIVNQEEADRDIPKLLAVPARVRFLSMEPLLGPVDLRQWTLAEHGRRLIGAQPGIDWVICGGESGPHARPMHPDWARSLRDQCAAAGVPFLFKQWGEWAADECQGPNVWRHLEVPRARLVVGEWKFEAADSGWPDDENMMFKLGKKAAGRLLDGRSHDQFPEVR